MQPVPLHQTGRQRDVFQQEWQQCDVVLGSQAYVREIEPGDIITKMNNKDISTMEQFRAALQAVAPGDALTMEVNHKGESKFKVLRAPASE